MMPAYSFTEYTSPSGATQIYIVRKPKQNALQRISERKKYIVKQKLLGLAAVMVGIVACVVFPEDAGGGLFAVTLGLIRLVSNR